MRLVRPVVATTVVAVLVGGLGVAAIPAAQAAGQVTTVTYGQLVDQAVPLKPIATGYNPTKFVTAAQWKKKDGRGCDLRKQMLIKSATIPPKVGKGCKVTGGTWYANGGAVRITDIRKVRLASLMSWKAAWGEGAYAWTPAQRYAWATNVMAPPRVRAVGVTYLQATNQIWTTEYFDALQKLSANRSNLASTFAFLDQVDATARLGFALMLAHSAQFAGYTEAQFLAELAKYNAAKQLCQQYVSSSILTNTSSWGLGVSPLVLATIRDAEDYCSWDLNITFNTFSYANVYNIKSANRAGEVPDGYANASDSKGVILFKDYGTPTTPAVTPALFGLHAPPDTGSMPTVPYGYLRLWDSGVSWADLNPAKGVYNWTKLKEALDSPQASGKQVMYVLGNTPAWAGDGSPNSAPIDMTSVYDFVKAMCGQGGGRIATYEAWNEGNLQTFWKGSPQQLADLTKQVRRALTDCPFGGNVVAASTGTRAEGAFVTNYTQYLAALKAYGWPIDGYAVHSYPSAEGGPNDRLDGVAQFKTMLATAGAPVKPIYDSEVNYGLAGLGQNHIDIDAPTSQAYISRTFIDSVRYGIDSVFWFLWTPAYYNKLGIQLDPQTAQNNAAWNTTYGWLVGARMQRCIDGRAAAGGPVVTECQLTRPGGANMTLVWTSSGTAPVNVEGLGGTQVSIDGTQGPVSGGSITASITPTAIL